MRAHLEEDAGKSLHEEFHGNEGIDLNRAGTPLLEIVTEPDMRSSEEAVAYAKELHKIVTWIGICDGNMQEGSFRCDANVSVRKPGQPLGTRREIKNLNSFRFMQQAIDYEIRWQIEELRTAARSSRPPCCSTPTRARHAPCVPRKTQPTTATSPTRICPAGDCPEWVETTRAQMTELPRAMAARFVQDYGLPEYDATTLTQSKPWRPTLKPWPRPAASQTGQQLDHGRNVAAPECRRNGDGASPLTTAQLATMLARIADGTISNNAAKQVFDALWQGEGSDVDAIIESRGLKQMNDSGALENHRRSHCSQPRQRGAIQGRQGQGVQRTGGPGHEGQQGKANPQQATDLLRARLG